LPFQPISYSSKKPLLCCSPWLRAESLTSNELTMRALDQADQALAAIRRAVTG